MNRSRHFRWPAAALVVAWLSAATVRGQDSAPPTFDDWKTLEPAQAMIDYKGKLKDGVFDDASKTFLVTVALPQLGMPKNRAMIDRVRRRIREVLCSDGGDGDGDKKAGAAATQTVADFMVAVARDGKADPVVRVNAALLVGELVAARKPWAPAVAPLVAMVGDAGLPPAVRIAAAAGLARHVDADAVARAADVGPALVTLVGSPLAGVDPVAADWLRSRALAMLARMGAAAPGESASAAARVLLDDGRAIDVRVRAAAAVGRAVKAPGDVDVAATVEAIRRLANAALAATQEEAERRKLISSLGEAGGQQLQPQALPGFDPQQPAASGAIGIQQCRRDAWRLATLADALAPVDGDGGLVRVAGATAPAVTALANALRTGAQTLDAAPGEVSLAEARQALASPDGNPPATAPAGGEAGDGGRPDSAPAPAAEPATGGSPFSDR